jgi:hypothetical protein
VVCCEPGKEPSGSIKGAWVTVSVLREEFISPAVCAEEALIICPRYGCFVCHYQNIEQRKLQMIPKLSGASYAIRSLVQISNINTLKSIYYAYFHSVIKY